MVPLPQGPLNTSRMTYQTCINPPNILREYVRSKQCLSIVLFSCKKKLDVGNQKVIDRSCCDNFCELIDGRCS